MGSFNLEGMRFTRLTGNSFEFLGCFCLFFWDAFTTNNWEVISNSLDLGGCGEDVAYP